MKISEEVRSLYTTYDPETSFFLDCFDEPENITILEVGAHDAPISTLLAKSGHSVVSVDLRDYDHEMVDNHKHITGDFNNATIPWGFDCVVSVSAIEHFGLGTYGELLKTYSDVIACRKIWELLKPGGTFYCVVPFGAKYVERIPHFRVYDYASLIDRIIQEFGIQYIYTRIVEQCMFGTEYPPVGQAANWPDILKNLHGSTAISALLKLRKV